MRIVSFYFSSFSFSAAFSLCPKRKSGKRKTYSTKNLYSVRLLCVSPAFT